MNINGYNPFKKGFDMLVADIQAHEAQTPESNGCKSCNRLREEVTKLRQFHHDQQELHERNDAVHKTNSILREQLAASQADNARLRECLEEAHEFIGDSVEDYITAKKRIDVLSQTTNDTTALDKYVKQEQAKMLREMVEDSKSWAMVDSFAGYMRRRADELEGGK